MLARLQQATTLGALLLAALWAKWCFDSGRPVSGIAGAALIVGAYALVLALEFILLYFAHGDDPAPRATPMQLLRAWWGEVRWAPQVFCWRQPFFSDRWPDHLPGAGRPGGPGVLLVHGFVCNRGVWNGWLQRLTQADVPFVAVNLEPVFGSIDDYVGIIEAAVRRLERHTGQPPIAVAHSMGGVALRRWWAERGNGERLQHAITIASPHQGTWLARFAVTRNALQMRRQSGWLRTLAAREDQHIRRLKCFYGHCDNIVFPPSTATLPGADNRHLPGVAHVHMVDAPEPWAELQRLLQKQA
ncbi:MAG TPA: permease [Rubrivivax sp.]|jgi:predicted alpha/beta hydrolase family esterase|nr:permease [Rubrivivax sp.]